MRSLTALVTLAGLFPIGVLAADPRPVNVLFIAADDLRNDLGIYGHPEVKTPHLDALARRGVTFTHAYCQQALCNPSRASLMTGRRPDTLRIWNLPLHFRELHPDMVTMPQWFMRHGYFAQDIGKIFHNWRQEIQGDPDSWSVPQQMHFATHGSDLPVIDRGPLPPDHSTDIKTECRDVPDNAYFDGRIAELAVNALQERKRAGKPFFLAVGFWKPHSPFNAPKKYWDLYDRNSITMPRHPDAPINVPAIALHDSREILTNNQRKLSPAAVREIRHGYLAAVSYLDAQIGRVISELERLDLARSTVVVFWSDHGYHLGEQSLWAKTSNFELDARVPLIIATPDGLSAGTTSDSPVELLDMYPTLVELCGLPQPEGLEGTSLVPALKDPQTAVKPAAYTQHPRPAYYNGQPDAMGVSVRTARYRYTEWRDFDTGRVIARELYDHSQDPEEHRNIVDETNDSTGLVQAERLLLRQFPRKPYQHPQQPSR